MSRRSVLVALGILLPILVVAVDRFVEVPSQSPVSASESARAKSRSDVPRPRGNVLEPATDPSPSPPVAAESPPDRREQEGIWIHGLVRVPAGLPPDDHVEVAGRFASLEQDEVSVSPVDGDGRFLVSFPADAEGGWLELRSRYLYLEQEVDVDLEAPPAEVVLEPRLGGCVRGRLVPSRPAKELSGIRVELCAPRGTATPGTSLMNGMVDRDLGFEIRAVPPRAGYILGVDVPEFFPEERTVDILPAATTEVRIDLHERARVSGRVVDPDGQPVFRASIRWFHPERPDFRIAGPPDAETSPDGQFTVDTVDQGLSTLIIWHEGFLPERREFEALGDGQQVTGVDVRLRPGLIAGVVKWADGAPVRRCSVQLGPIWSGLRSRSRSLPFWDDSHSTSQASFSFSVASEGPYRLNVRTEPSNDPGGGREGFATVDDLRPGQAPLTVLLDPGNTIRGNVVDDLGHPLAKFHVIAHAKGSESVSFPSRTDDGSFALGGLSDGRWTFVAGDDLGLFGPESEAVDLPSSSPLLLVVPRAAEISGIVLAPSGDPAPFAFLQPGFDETTDSEGRFRLTHVRPGSISVTASSRSWVASEPMDVQAKPGEKIGDLVLKLRRGGRIAGTAFDKEGRDWGNVTVWIENEDGDLKSSCSTDASGRFVSEWLLPGDYAVCEHLVVDEWVDADEKDPGPRVPVAVVEGKVTTVVVGKPR